MKTDEQLVALALKMAEDDENVAVMFALRTYHEAKHFLSLARSSSAIGSGVLKMQGMAVDYPNGSRVMFRNVSKANVSDCAGYQLTYLFLPRHLDFQAEAFLKGRVRSARSAELKVPMGIYKPYWVERWHTYKEVEKE